MSSGHGDVCKHVPTTEEVCVGVVGWLFTQILSNPTFSLDWAHPSHLKKRPSCRPVNTQVTRAISLSPHMSEVTWQDVDVYMHMSVCHQTQRLLHAVQRSSTTSSSWRSRKVSLAFCLHFDIAIQYLSRPCLSIRFSQPYGLYLFVASLLAFFFLLLRLLCFASVGVLRCF